MAGAADSAGSGGSATGSPVLRIASSDLHDHVVRSVGACFETGSYCDLVLRCGLRRRSEINAEDLVYAHKVVLSAVSPYIRHLLETSESKEDVLSLELPESSVAEVKLLIEVIYNGVIEASLEELRALIFLARDLRIQIPVSADMLKHLDIELPALHGPSTTLPRSTSLEMMPSLGPNLKRPHNGTSPAVRPPPLKRSNLVGPLRPPSYPSTSRQAECTEELLCPLCNSKYTSLENWRNHMKYHEEENLKAAKNEMMNDLVAQSFSSLSNLYTCSFCSSTYSHPGNFKQHLGKHERETGCVSSAYGLMIPSPPPAPIAIQASTNDQRESTKAVSTPLLSPVYEASSLSGSAHLNSLLKNVYVDKMEKDTMKKSCGSTSHLNSLLQSSFADKVDKGLAGDDEMYRKFYHCDVCGRSFKHPGNYKQHIASHMRLTTSNSAALRLPEAVAAIPAAIAAAASAETIRPKLEPISANESGAAAKKKTSKAITKCEICDEVFPTEALLHEHKASNHQIAFRPPSPGYLLDAGLKKAPLSRAPSAESEEQGVDPLESPASPPSKGSSEVAQNHLFHCDLPMCFESFSKEAWLVRHKEQAHGFTQSSTAGQLQCDLCPKTFTCRLNFARHLKTHKSPDEQAKLKCELCGKVFSRMQHLRRHRLLHVGHDQVNSTGKKAPRGSSLYGSNAAIQGSKSAPCDPSDDDDEDNSPEMDEEDLLFKDDEDDDEALPNDHPALLVKAEVLEEDDEVAAGDESVTVD